LKNNLYSNTIYVIDVETTGISPKSDRITEIGIVKITNGKITDEFDTLINPEQYISSYITDLTGITNEMVYGKPNFAETYPYIREFMSDSNAVIGGHNVRFDFNFLNNSLVRNGFEPLHNDIICTARIARRLNLGIQRKSLKNLTHYFGIRQARRHRALDDAMATAKILIKLIKIIKEQFNFEEQKELISFQYKKISSIRPEPPRIKQVRAKARELPEKPGVYMFKDKTDRIIYVGKAKSLRARVSSYFVTNENHPEKLRKLLRKIHDVEYNLTGSELSALIEESRLIKKLKPDFNSALKRIRYYPYIKIDIQNDYPIVEKTYEIKMDGAKYYGPFRSNFTVNTILEKIKKEYKVRKCEDKKLVPDKNFSPCMYHQIGVCDAPCDFTISRDEYRVEISRVEMFIESQTSDSAIKDLVEKMFSFSEQLQYEDAAYLRDKITDLRKVLMNKHLSTDKGYKQNFIVKCPNGMPGKYEVFFVGNGKLIERELYDTNKTDQKKYNVIRDKYYKGNLFSSVYYNKKEKLSNEEIDAMKIIMNWAYINNSDRTLLLIEDSTSSDDIINFIKTV
jgi:DNA polymerase-3 subunit epsilon